MKKLTLLIVFGFTLQTIIYSQPCLPEGIIFTSQTQIDNFQINHPNCSEIEGDVEIYGYDITNLEGLSVITTIWGDLRIGKSTAETSLTNLSGLDSLAFIGGDLRIINNSLMNSLIGLEKLAFIEGTLAISEINVLTNLTGLENLDSIGESLGISDCADFTDLTGVNSLMSIGGTLSIADNESLSSLSGLESLTSIGEDVHIGVMLWDMGNPSLTSISALGNVTSIGGVLEIANNPLLSSLTGLENIDATSITDLFIHNNTSLSICDIQSLCNYLNSPNGSVNIYNNASGCNNPAEIAFTCGDTLSCLPYGNYYFKSQSEVDSFQSNYPGCTQLEGNVRISGSYITNLDELITVTSVSGRLEIYDNELLLTLSGLDSINYIGGDLSFGEYGIGGYNYVLDNLHGLENLDSIGGSLLIGKCLSLQSLTGLEGLKSIGDYFLIGFANESLTDISSLSNLNSIGGSLYVGTLDGWNTTLANLSGLENLGSIGGSLHIVMMSALADLSALYQLTSIGGNIYIYDNDALPSLSGLDNIDAASINELSILGNQLLSQCEVQSVCDYLILPGGYISISDNATGCESQEEVDEACETIGVEENIHEPEISIYPNPATDKLTITNSDGLKIESVCIYNQLGQKVLHLNEIRENIDISTLEQGIYIIELTSNELKIREKLVINE